MPSVFILFQYLVPQHLLSRLVGYFAGSEFFSRPFIKFFSKRYNIDLSEAEIEDSRLYPTFNAFFTRALKPNARPLPESDNCIVSPADGEISQIGKIENDRIFQAKGQDYGISKLLACTDQQATAFVDGSFATVYLSPRDYHRVHMPLTGTLTKTTYIPRKTVLGEPENGGIRARAFCS